MSLVFSVVMFMTMFCMIISDYLILLKFIDDIFQSSNLCFLFLTQRLPVVLSCDCHPAFLETLWLFGWGWRDSGGRPDHCSIVCGEYQRRAWGCSPALHLLCSRKLWFHNHTYFRKSTTWTGIANVYNLIYYPVRRDRSLLSHFATVNISHRRFIFDSHINIDAYLNIWTQKDLNIISLGKNTVHWTLN